MRLLTKLAFAPSDKQRLGLTIFRRGAQDFDVIREKNEKSHRQGHILKLQNKKVD